MKLFILQMDSRPQSSRNRIVYGCNVCSDFWGPRSSLTKKSGSFLKGVKRGLSSTKMLIALCSLGGLIRLVVSSFLNRAFVGLGNNAVKSYGSRQLDGPAKSNMKGGW